MQVQSVIPQAVERSPLQEEVKKYSIDLVIQNLTILGEVAIGGGALTTEEGKIYLPVRIWTALGWKPDLEVIQNTFKVASSVYFDKSQVEIEAEKKLMIKKHYEEGIRGLERTLEYWASDVEFVGKIKEIIQEFTPPEYNGIPTYTALNNQKILATFPSGSKPMMDISNQTIAPKNYFGELDFDVLDKTIEKAILVRRLVLEGNERLKPISDEMETLYEDHRQGVRAIAHTYTLSNDPDKAQKLCSLLEKHTFYARKNSDPIPIPPATMQHKIETLDTVLKKPRIKQPDTVYEAPPKEKAKRPMGTNPYQVTNETLKQTKLRRTAKTGEKKKNLSSSDREDPASISEFQKKYAELKKQSSSKRESSSVTSGVFPSTKHVKTTKAKKREEFIQQSKEKGKRTIQLIRKTTTRLPNPFRKKNEQPIEESIVEVEERLKAQMQNAHVSMNNLLLQSPLLEQAWGKQEETKTEDVDEGWSFINLYEEDHYLDSKPPLLRSTSETSLRSKPLIKESAKNPLERQQSAIFASDLRRQMQQRRLSIEGKNLPKLLDALEL